MYNSTSGILSAIFSVVKLYKRCKYGHNSDPVFILGRDSHKSAFDALSLAECDSILSQCYIDTNFNIPLGISYDSIHEALTVYGSRVCGVLLTRPTYQGVLTTTVELKRIIDLCHRYSVPVIIDEAHGSHLRFLPTTNDVTYSGNCHIYLFDIHEHVV